MSEMQPIIRVGIITAGKPRFVEPQYLENLLIGERFHWQSSIAARFEGEFIALPEPQGNIHVVNELPLEQYLKYVIGSEMNPNAPLEFLKAHAVISRSWALRKIIGEDRRLSEGKVESRGRIITWDESDSHVGFDVCSDDHCQRYQGVPPEGSERSVEAVLATEGEVLTTKDGMVADARFSKCCGGVTERFSSCWRDEDFDYLVSQKDPWCDLSDMEPVERKIFLGKILKGYDESTDNFHDWEVCVPKHLIVNNIRNKFQYGCNKVLGLKAIKKGDSGRIVELKVSTDKGDIVVGKELAVRRLLADSHLLSSWFDIEDNGDTYRLIGHGWGHGVGLCQIGAARMAFEGKNYREILDFYYPNTTITKRW